MSRSLGDEKFRKYTIYEHWYSQCAFASGTTLIRPGYSGGSSLPSGIDWYVE
jgi:hypothetical protein